jgi:hypothetical protein
MTQAQISRVVTVPVNAPSAASAAEAVRLHLTRTGRPFLHVDAATTATCPRPDSEVALTVTRPAGPRSTFLVLVTVARR